VAFTPLRTASWANPLNPATWNVHDVVLLTVDCARINRPSLVRPACIAYTVTTLLYGDWAIYDPHPTPLVYTIHNTILALAIACKGQPAITPSRYLPFKLAGRRWHLRLWERANPKYLYISISICICMYVYIYIYTCIGVYINIYIYI